MPCVVNGDGEVPTVRAWTVNVQLQLESVARRHHTETAESLTGLDREPTPEPQQVIHPTDGSTDLNPASRRAKLLNGQDDG